MIADIINDYTLFTPTLPPPSAYYKIYSPTTLMPKYTFNKASILTTKLISGEMSEPCYKTYIKNMDFLLEEDELYLNSDVKKQIKDNISMSLCGIGTSEQESKDILVEKIKSNVKIYEILKNRNENINHMSLISFNLINRINDKISSY